MQEDFLHFVWQFQQFNKKGLTTSEGEAVNIIKPGVLNVDAGPDFRESKIIIGEVQWVGHTEIHIYASDWNQHNHDEDDAYNNVILHVVWENDQPLFRKDGSTIPVIELKQKISHDLIHKWEELAHNIVEIPCASQLYKVKDLIRLSMMDKALFERLEAKANAVLKMLENNGNDWENTTYQLLAGNFGFKINSEQFIALSHALPLKVLLKHQDNIFQLEALLFGQAGLLEHEDDPDEYFLSLRKEYLFLKHKYDLDVSTFPVHEWKFLRLRPANFPTIRIAQFAMVLHKTSRIFSFIKEVESPVEIAQVFSVIQSAYWRKHYHFGKQGAGKIAGIGKSSIENIIINTIVPVLAAYGLYTQQQQYIDKGIELLQSVSAEENKITRLWAEANIKVKTGFDSQALIQLYNHYCRSRRCLSCNIGTTLIRKDNT